MRADNRKLSLQPLLDTELWLARKRRALARPVEGADFLMRRAAEDLADRLGAVERRFGKAAALFCRDPDGNALEFSAVK